MGLFGGLFGGGDDKKGDTPDAPDYTGAANATSQGSVQAAIANNLMAHPNIYTPLGSQTWNQTGTTTVPGVGGQPAFDIPTYSQTVDMTPEGQHLYDEQMGLSTGLLGLGNSSLDQARQALGSGLNTSALPKNVSSLSQGNFKGGPAPTTSGGPLNPTGGRIQGQINPQAYDRNQVINSLYRQQTSRLDPQWKQQEEATRTQLANQGLVPGGEAYTNAMRDQSFAKNDAYNSALNSAIGNATAQQQAQFGMAQGAGQFANQAQQQGYGQQLSNANLNLGAQQQAFGQQATSTQMGNQAEQARLAQQQQAGTFQNQSRQQQLQEAAYLRQLPLTELNAIRTGAQPQMPQFQPSQYSMGAQGPNMLSAANQQYQGDLAAYNAQVGQQNSMMGGLFGLGGAALMAPTGTFSDRRLKSNIQRIGTHPLGIGLYAYDIFGERTIGVMADEAMAVRPEAVSEHASGYLMVDYGRL